LLKKLTVLESKFTLPVDVIKLMPPSAVDCITALPTVMFPDVEMSPKLNLALVFIALGSTFKMLIVYSLFGWYF
jgi:hypothetical protein